MLRPSENERLKLFELFPGKKRPGPKVYVRRHIWGHLPEGEAVKARVVFLDDPVEHAFVEVSVGGQTAMASSIHVPSDDLGLCVSPASTMTFTILSRLIPVGGPYLFRALLWAIPEWGRERAALILELERATREMAAPVQISMLEPKCPGLAGIVRRARRAEAGDHSRSA